MDLKWAVNCMKDFYANIDFPNFTSLRSNEVNNKVCTD